jgi:hypothetical protein
MGATTLAYAVCDPFDEFAANAHEVLQEWLEGLRPTLEAERLPNLRELSDLFTTTRGQLLGGCLKAAIECLFRPQLEETTICCELCGRRLSRRRLDSKTCSTLQGEFVLERPYFYCQKCCWSSHPLDIALGLSRRRHQYDVQEQVTLLAADLPYEAGADHFSRLTGIEVGNHFAFDTLTAVAAYAGPERVVPPREEIASRVETAIKAGGNPVLVVAIDGAHTPIRPPGGRKHKRGKGEWKETKGVRLYLVSDDDRIIQVASWHRNGDTKDFAWDLKRIATRIPDVEIPVAVVADGAPWIWALAKKQFPDARQVLDYYHCSQHVHAVANEQYPDPSVATAWAQATLARLSLGRVGVVIAGLRRMKPRNTSVCEDVRKLIGYLVANRDRVAYGSCKADGIPKGSGGIESANKYIHHTRLKRSGAWWLKPNANKMLAIRCAIYNHTFKTVFDRHVAFETYLLNI